MASAEIMRAGVLVAFAFLLSEISTLLAKADKKKRICLCKELDLEKESAGRMRCAHSEDGVP
jgi:hypothetical protein